MAIREAVQAVRGALSGPPDLGDQWALLVFQ